MKLKLIFLALAVALSTASTAQFFKPLPLPGAKEKLAATAANPLVQNSFRPLVGISATIVADGTQLAGGVGAGFQHNIFDQASQKWVSQYSISALAFLDTKANVIGGLLFGLANNLVQIGPGYNFGTKQFAILTGVGLNPF